MEGNQSVSRFSNLLIREGLQELTPSVVRQKHSLKRFAVLSKKHALVTDLAGDDHSFTKRQLPWQHFEGARAELDLTVLIGFGSILLPL